MALRRGEARALRDEGAVSQAQAKLSALLADQARVLGESANDVVMTRLDLGELELEFGDTQRGLQRFCRARQQWAEFFGKTHRLRPQAAVRLTELGGCPEDL